MLPRARQGTLRGPKDGDSKAPGRALGRKQPPGAGEPAPRAAAPARAFLWKRGARPRGQCPRQPERGWGSESAKQRGTQRGDGAPTLGPRGVMAHPPLQSRLRGRPARPCRRSLWEAPRGCGSSILSNSRAYQTTSLQGCSATPSRGEKTPVRRELGGRRETRGPGAPSPPVRLVVSYQTRPLRCLI